MRATLLAAMCFLFVGCVSPPKTATPGQPKAPPEPRVTVAITAEQEAAAKTTIAGMLKDPESARFSGVIGVQRVGYPNSTAVCGNVNAKNSYGGYVGSVPFMVVGSRGQLWDSTSRFARVMNDLITTVCTPTATASSQTSAPSTPAASKSSASSTSPASPPALSREQWRQQQLDQLNSETGLNYEEYQRRYKTIIGQ
ncbi:hypothetical protein M5C90_24605 [Pseudomonas chlororaphis subsp. piscium]|nr:hypothetical protein M5C90_24605 [Pseudomonas chlororaphis subsp. piscium]